MYHGKTQVSAAKYHNLGRELSHLGISHSAAAVKYHGKALDRDVKYHENLRITCRQARHQARSTKTLLFLIKALVTKFHVPFERLATVALVVAKYHALSRAKRLGFRREAM